MLMSGRWRGAYQNKSASGQAVCPCHMFCGKTSENPFDDLPWGNSRLTKQDRST